MGKMRQIFCWNDGIFVEDSLSVQKICVGDIRRSKFYCKIGNSEWNFFCSIFKLNCSIEQLNAKFVMINSEIFGYVSQICWHEIDKYAAINACIKRLLFTFDVNNQWRILQTVHCFHLPTVDDSAILSI